MSKNRLTISIHDLRCSDAVGIDEVCVCVGFIIWTLDVTVTKRCLDRCQSRYGLAVALELACTFLVGSLNCCLDLLNGDGVALGDDQGNGILLLATVLTCFRFPYICVRPAGIHTGHDLGRICHLLCHVTVPP